MRGLRILLVSPTPTHPQNAGNRARIFHLAEQLRAFGCDLYFVYYRMEEADVQAMEEYWGERMLIVPRKAPALHGSAAWNSMLIRLGDRLRSIGIERPSLYGRALGIDDWFTQSLAKAVRRLDAKERFQVAWVEYIFLSKILDSFDSSVLKIIDTHDIFSNRHKRMMAQGIQPEWFYTTPEMEKRGLGRADWVVAIQKHDAEFFRALGLSRVETIGHLLRANPIQPSNPGNRILFVGSENSLNVRAWEYFTSEVLGRIERRSPGASIRVAGKVCERIPASSRYEKLGRIDDLRALYESTTVVINPMTWGTGLKIKTIEPLAYGCPVVTTPAGIEGIEEAENRGILVGRTPEEFAECVELLLTQPSYWEQQRLSAQDFLNDYLRRNRQCLANVLSEHGTNRER